MTDRLAGTHGARGVLLRLTAPRYTFPAGGYTSAPAPPAAIVRTATDTAAMLCALAVVFGVTALHGLLPWEPDTRARSWGAVWPPALLVGLTVPFLIPATSYVADAMVGALPTTFKRVVLPTLLLSVGLVAVLVALFGCVTLQVLVMTGAYLGSVLAVLSWEAPRNPAPFLIVEILISLSPVVVTVGYLAAFAAASGSALLQLAAGLGFDAGVFALKHVARTRPGIPGVLIAEFCVDSLGHALFLYTVPKQDTAGFAVLLLVQMAGVAGAAVLAAPAAHKVMPWLSSSSSSSSTPTSTKATRATRFGVSCIAQAVTTLAVLLAIVVQRAGPNKAEFSSGYWSAEEADRAVWRCAVWAAAMLVLLAAGRWKLRPDPVSSALDLIAEHLAVGLSPMVGTVVVHQLALQRQGQLAWWLWPEDGQST